MTINLTIEQAADVFNEWARRYAADPESFGPVLDVNGQVVEDYGRSCSVYFKRIADDLSMTGVLAQQ